MPLNSAKLSIENKQLRACHKCLWWEAFNEAAREGRCRINPPVIPGNSTNASGFWPLTLPRDWCASFAPGHQQEPETA